MPVVKAKEDLQCHWWLTSERILEGGKAPRILNFHPILISNDTFLGRMDDIESRGIEASQIIEPIDSSL